MGQFLFSQVIFQPCGLRDSAAQITPYLVPSREDPELAAVIAGLIKR